MKILNAIFLFFLVSYYILGGFELDNLFELSFGIVLVLVHIFYTVWFGKITPKQNTFLYALAYIAVVLMIISAKAFNFLPFVPMLFMVLFFEILFGWYLRSMMTHQEIHVKFDSHRPEDKQKDYIFISYSPHADDQPYFDEIKRQLATLKSYGLTNVHVWDNTQLKSGDDWLHEIKTALAKTKVAVLLVSPNFLGSDFINEKAVPAFLNNVQQNGGKIMSVILRKTLFDMHPTLSKYQSVNSPEKPLSTLTEPEKDEVYAKLLKDILTFYKAV